MGDNMTIFTSISIYKYVVIFFYFFFQIDRILRFFFYSIDKLNCLLFTQQKLKCNQSTYFLIFVYFNSFMWKKTDTNNKRYWLKKR